MTSMGLALGVLGVLALIALATFLQRRRDRRWRLAEAELMRAARRPPRQRSSARQESRAAPQLIRPADRFRPAPHLATQPAVRPYSERRKEPLGVAPGAAAALRATEPVETNPSPADPFAAQGRGET